MTPAARALASTGLGDHVGGGVGPLPGSPRERRYALLLGGVARAAGVFGATIGAVFAVAWSSGAAARWSAAGALVMKTNMALALLLAGVALLLLATREPTPVRRGLAAAGGGVVLLIGAATLCEHLFGWELGLDQLLASEPPGAMGTASPNRIGLPGAASLALLGAGLILSAGRRPLAAYLGLATCVVAAVPAIGFLFGVSPFYATRTTGIAWPTVLALLALGFGLMLVRRDRSPFAILWRDDPGGDLARRLLVPSVLIPVVLGWLRVEGERRGLYDAPTGSGLYAAVLMLVLAALLSFNARQVSKADAALRESEQRLRALADSMPQLAWTARADGSITWYNRRWYEYTGTTPEQMAGWGWQAVHDPARLPEVLRRWSASVSSGSAFEMEFPLRRADGEFRRFLTRVFPLKDRDGKVLQWFGTNTDVTELVEAQEALREAARRKDEFLGMLSHELRNPLAPIRNAVFVLERAEAASEPAVRARAAIKRQAEHLTRIVDDLLDVTRIARGKIELHRSRVELRELVAQAAEDFRPLLSERNVAFRTALPDAAVWVDADATRLTQLVGNLLHNAAKFTRSGDEVTLSLRPVDGQAELSVSDTGIGIEPALLAQVFDPFVQGERTLARTEGGLGLGLAVVKAVAELHGGSVRAESAGAGRGATFHVRIPLAAAGSPG